MKEDVPAKIIFSLLLFVIYYRSTIMPEINNLNECNDTVQVDTDMYCSYSESKNIALLLIPKSGSSTGRHLIKHELGGKDILCKYLPPGVKVIAIVRDPYKRFLSSYDEMFVRKLGKGKLIPRQYRNFMKPFEGYKYKDYEKRFNTKELDDAFKAFVDSYDGRQVFDVHLMTQISAIKKYNVKTYTDINTMFKDIIKPLLNDHTAELIRGRAYPRRFNVDQIELKTQKKICTLVKEDYCCLGLKIPLPCQKQIQCIHTK